MPSSQANTALLQQGLAAHKAGRLNDAEVAYRQVLQSDPRNINAQNLLGVILMDKQQWAEAEVLLRKAHDQRPSEPGFILNLASCLYAMGRYQEAMGFWSRLVALKPGDVNLMLNLCKSALASGQNVLAEEYARKCLALQPGNAQALYVLGDALRRLKKNDEAEKCLQLSWQSSPMADTAVALGACRSAVNDTPGEQHWYRLALEVNPNHPGALANLGISLSRNTPEGEQTTREELDKQAKGFLIRALEANPACPAEVPLSLAVVLTRLQESELAMSLYQQVFDAEDSPMARRADAAEMLSRLLFDLGKYDEGTGVLMKWSEIDPKCARPLARLASMQSSQGSLETAREMLEKALAREPDDVIAMGVKAGLLSHSGQVKESLEMLDRLLNQHAKEATDDKTKSDANTLKLEMPSFVSMRAMIDLYSPDFDPARNLQLHRNWAKAVVSDAGQQMPELSNDKDPERKLRVGYVSTDLRNHVVATFMKPILESHNKHKVDVVVFDASSRPDATTKVLMPLASAWHRVRVMDEAKLARFIRSQKIDVLVDLSGHTQDSKLSTFAFRAAPVQVTYLGYPATTGLEQMDYRLTDEVADPPGMTDAYHTEKLYRLNRCAWVWDASQQAKVPIKPLPALKNGFITFGSFNNFIKITPDQLQLWGNLLAALPGSKLMIKARALADAKVSARAMEFLLSGGADRQQIDLRGFVEHSQHMELQGSVDIALDSFPYNGTTTTLDCLYHGLPVLTLCGKHHVSRVSTSLMHYLGLEGWSCQTKQQYIERAVEWAGRVKELSELRNTLRPKLQSSQLMNGPDMAKALEEAYQDMWRQWCTAKQTA